MKRRMSYRPVEHSERYVFMLDDVRRMLRKSQLRDVSIARGKTRQCARVFSRRLAAAAQRRNEESVPPQKSAMASLWHKTLWEESSSAYRLMREVEKLTQRLVRIMVETTGDCYYDCANLRTKIEAAQPPASAHILHWTHFVEELRAATFNVCCHDETFIQEKQGKYDHARCRRNISKALTHLFRIEAAVRKELYWEMQLMLQKNDLAGLGGLFDSMAKADAGSELDTQSLAAFLERTSSPTDKALEAAVANAVPHGERLTDLVGHHGGDPLRVSEHYLQLLGRARAHSPLPHDR